MIGIVFLTSNPAPTFNRLLVPGADPPCEEEFSRMVLIALSSTLIGAVLGTRFRVQILFPVAVLGFVIVAIVASLKGSGTSTAMLAVVVLVLSLQIGYLGGLLTRFYMAASRIASHRPLRSTSIRS